MRADRPTWLTTLAALAMLGGLGLAGSGMGDRRVGRAWSETWVLFQYVGGTVVAVIGGVALVVLGRRHPDRRVRTASLLLAVLGVAFLTVTWAIGWAA